MRKVFKSCDNCLYGPEYSASACGHCDDVLSRWLYKYGDVPSTYLGNKEQSDGPTPSYYNHSYKGVKLDPYRVAECWGITNHPQFHAWKKVGRAHLENHKTMLENIDEAIQCLERWKEMIKEDKES